jgi:exoribonuclease R
MVSVISNLWNNIFNNNFKDIQKNFHREHLLSMDSINRIDYKHLKIYSIDPENCTDADDAFSIFVDNNIHLMIHIADPTAYFKPSDDLFKDIITNGTTIYLSNREPDHMFPDNILDACSLINGIKNVLIVHTEMNHNFEIIKSNVEYGIINCDNGYRYSYNNVVIDDTIQLGLEIAKSFRNKRNCFSDNLSLTIPSIIENMVMLKPDTDEIKIMKNMIAEFAIHANTIFANELDINNLFLRKLETFNKNYDNIHDLIKDGISAKYTTENKQHNLIGTNNIYTHSTSPLRRASDCIVHFLLKAKHLNIEPPFNQTQLELYAEHLNKKTKENKNIQFKDIKLRTFQWIAEELEYRLNCIKMKVKIIDIREPYINLMIIKLDDMDVNIPYTIRKKPNTNNINININNIFNINITKIKPYKKFDEGTLPELDNIINPKP